MLKLKIPSKESIAEYLKQRNESVSWKIKWSEITSEEQNKVKRMRRTEDGFRDLWDNIKHTKIQIIGFPGEEEKKKGYEKTFEEIIVANFPSMEKEIFMPPSRFRI